jgi:DNA-binding MarR family transcriptional regulator
MNQAEPIQPKSFIGKQADDLSNLILEQIKPIYHSIGIIVPVKSCSIIYYLDKLNDMSVTDLAKQLKQSHQLVKQKLPKLHKLGLIHQQSDENDKRRSTYHLTDSGQQQAQLLAEHSLYSVYQHLSDEVGADINQVLATAIRCLKQKDLFTRFQENK